eukprot:scaffold12616_cov199-Skeletonema_marinoi.AAC.1
MEHVADILTNDTSGTGCVATNLTKIHFYNNMSKEGGCRQFARILEKSSKLTDIRFSSTRAGRDGSDIVASALDVALEEGRNANLEKLDLCDNNFGNKASQDALFRALGCTASLSYLDLRDCELEDDGVKKVCHALVGSDSALEHLDLSGNTVEHRGAKQIANYIRDSGGKLKGLCLDDNDLKSKGVVHIASAFHGSGDGHAIERLQLNFTACGAIGARALIEAFGPGGKSGAELTKICLDGNYFKEDVVGELGHAFNDVLVEMEDNNSDGEEEDDNKGEEEDDNKLCYACKGDGHSCRTCDGDGELKAKSDCYTCSGDGYVLGDMNQSVFFQPFLIFILRLLISACTAAIAQCSVLQSRVGSLQQAVHEFFLLSIRSNTPPSIVGVISTPAAISAFTSLDGTAAAAAAAAQSSESLLGPPTLAAAMMMTPPSSSPSSWPYYHLNPRFSGHSQEQQFVVPPAPAVGHLPHPATAAAAQPLRLFPSTQAAAQASCQGVVNPPPVAAASAATSSEAFFMPIAE